VTGWKFKMATKTGFSPITQEIIKIFQNSNGIFSGLKVPKINK